MLSIPLHDNVVFQENDPYVEPLFVDDNGRILRFALKPGQTVREYTATHSPIYIMILKGIGLFSGSDNREQRFGPGALLIFDTGESHTVRTDSEELIFVAFPPGTDADFPANGQNIFLNTKTAVEAILVIDDHVVVRQALSDIFSDFYPEMPVYTAASGHEGIQIVQQQPVRLVLLDLNMPVMNGEQTYEKLQQMAPQVKVIVSSSLTPTEARLRFGERILPTYLQKPYGLTDLLNAVQTELALA